MHTSHGVNSAGDVDEFYGVYGHSDSIRFHNQLGDDRDRDFFL